MRNLKFSIIIIAVVIMPLQLSLRVLMVRSLPIRTSTVLCGFLHSGLCLQSLPRLTSLKENYTGG